jgi:hypothetical protein
MPPQQVDRNKMLTVYEFTALVIFDADDIITLTAVKMMDSLRTETSLPF